LVAEQLTRVQPLPVHLLLASLHAESHPLLLIPMKRAPLLLRYVQIAKHSAEIAQGAKTNAAEASSTAGIIPSRLTSKIFFIVPP
jgi:hypothetical protein